MTKTEKKSYKTATGEIKYALKSDIVFHYVMQKSEKALMGLVCALRGIKISDVESIKVENPIDLNGLAKESVMDLKLSLNSGVIMNIELQMYTDKFWIPRSLLYLCRAFDSIKEGENYSELKETVHYCITDQELFNVKPEFYANYALINKKNHSLYSDMLGINVLQLQYADYATQEDVDNDLVYWAKLFSAETWEELQALVEEREYIEEVADMILELNTDNQAKEILEGQRRYREQMATQYAAGRIDERKENEEEIQNLHKEVAKKDNIIDNMSNELAEKDNELVIKDNELAEKDTVINSANATIEELKAEIERLKNSK